MKILDFVRPDLVVADVQGRDKNAVIDELAGHLAAHVPGLDHEALRKVLLERERLASTAIGDGIAIPHGKMSIGRLVGCVGRSRQGTDFDSMDGRPTHIFFVLVAPENSTGIHLKALARISRLCKDSGVRDRIMRASDADEMFRIIADEDGKY